MARTATARPVPVPDALSAGYWKAAASHQLVLARCARCQRFSHPPAAVCGECGAFAHHLSYKAVSGSGVVRSWTIVRQALLPGFEKLVPYVLVDVEMDAQQGLRMTGRWLESVEDQPAPGDKVAVQFEDLAEGISVPAFRRPV